MATLEIPVEYIAFAHEAQTNRSSYPDAKAWARDYARKFYHEISTAPGFLPIYKTLLELNTMSPDSLPITQTKTYPTFEKNFLEEFDKSILSLDGDFEAWARTEATRLYWLFERQTKWKVLYDALFDRAIYLTEGTNAEDEGYITFTASSSNAAQAETVPTFEKNFNQEFETALISRDNYKNLRLWARAQTMRMYWLFQGKTKFKTIYNAIMDRATGMMDSSSAAAASASNAVATTSSAAASAIAAAPTDAEQKAGRNQLNKILHREFDLWWDAFQAEADEDTAKHAPTAEDRFSWHAAKVLRKKTDLPIDDLVPVVGAWLHERLQADE